jgi:hypothetical protein
MWFWILMIILVLLLVSAAPTWPHSREWGYGPSGGFGLLLAILLILLLLGVFEVPGCTVATSPDPGVPRTTPVSP